MTTLSAALKARKITVTDDADEDASPVKEKLERKPSFYRRLSQRDPPAE